MLGVDLPVLQEQLDAFESTPAVGHHAGWVGQGGEELAQDPQTGFLPTTAGDLATNSVLEACQSKASGAGEVTSISTQDHAHRRNPGA